MDAYAQLIEDSDTLRELIQRWRSTPENTAALLPEVARAIRTTAAAKEQVVYPAIRQHDPHREGFVDDAIRTNTTVDAFLTEAEALAPDKRGFLDEAHAVAAAEDDLLLHERRDLFPALKAPTMPENELARIVDRFRTARAYYADEATDQPLLQAGGRTSTRGGTAVEGGR
ncbi:MAG: hypothetical protein HOV68_04850 [Streptomycetaceae bacterium]|nr:hypothetical protein [Streptomycetaceae bacterium]